VNSRHNSFLDAPSAAVLPQIEELSEDILRSAPFRTSRQCQDLFRYIVQNSLAGSDESLRERVIGIEVFGRAADYDTSEDPVVRIRAADVRKRLAQYYQSRGEPGHWKIEIPTGSYRAQFHPLETALAQAPVSATAIPPWAAPGPSSGQDSLSPSSRYRHRKLLWVLALVAGCLAAGIASVLLARTASHPATAFDLFWEPVLASSRPVFVCAGSNPVYIVSPPVLERYEKTHSYLKHPSSDVELVLPSADLKNLKGEDFVPVKDTYLTVGDASAASQISGLLTSRRHPYDLRFGSDLSFGDLRRGSAVLIGAFNNSWTLSMTDSLRFVFDSGNGADKHIQDRFDATRSWWPKFSADGKVTEDYAIVSRILDSKTGSVLVTIAGVNHSGTQAAGDFATNPQLIADFVKHAPKDWNKKNLQIVLHTNVANNVPTLPTVVEAYYW
jgi:hypothetical protein